MSGNKGCAAFLKKNSFKALKLDTRAIQFIAYFVDVMHFECHMTKTITPGEFVVDFWSDFFSEYKNP